MRTTQKIIMVLLPMIMLSELYYLIGQEFGYSPVVWYYDFYKWLLTSTGSVDTLITHLAFITAPMLLLFIILFRFMISNLYALICLKIAKIFIKEREEESDPYPTMYSTTKTPKHGSS